MTKELYGTRAAAHDEFKGKLKNVLKDKSDAMIQNINRGYLTNVSATTKEMYGTRAVVKFFSKSN